MTTLVLHGSLGTAVGRETWNLQIQSVAEGIRAIETMTRKLVKQVYENEKKGIVYRVLIGDKDFDDEQELIGPLPKNKEVHIVPVIQGAGGEWWQQVLIGVGLIALSFTPLGGISLGAYASTGSIFFSAGLAFSLGGLAQLLSPSPDLDVNEQNEPSSTVGGIRNTVAQGRPVPLAYGELIVGSHMVSLWAENVDAPLTA